MNGAQFLEVALSSERLSAADIAKLRNEHVREDQWLEYKRGKWLDREGGRSKPGEPHDAAGKVKKWVTAFANAEGGALIVGMAGHEEQNDLAAFALEGCPTMSRGLTVWAQGVLRELLPYLPGQIRYHEVEIEGHTLLVVAVPRALSLIACNEHGQNVYYYRNDDATVAMSAGLFTDLMAGRRKRPYVSFGVRTSLKVHSTSNTIRLGVTVRNEGLVPVKAYACGAVCHANPKQGVSVGLGIARFANLGNASTLLPSLKQRVFLLPAPKALPPFDVRVHMLNLEFPRAVAGVSRTRWWFVVFLAADGDLPRMKQIDVISVGGRVYDFGIADVPPAERGRVHFETGPSPWPRSSWRERAQAQ